MGEVGMANNNFDFLEFQTRETLTQKLKEKIAQSLTYAIEKKGFATLVLSGGSTPLQLFKKLSLEDLAWEKVKITLVDERWVQNNSDKSNERLVRENLLVNYASKANFFPLKIDEEFAKNGVNALEKNLEEFSSKLDVVVLGMGLDGHTASFFPHAAELEEALNTKSLVCATTASVEPKERITLSRSYLLSATNLFLHIETKEKKDVFLKASESDDYALMPIISMMQQQEPLLEVYYAD